MSVSVILPAYNGEKYLADAIESVRAQTIPDWELVIVDDGSEDASRSIAADYAGCDPRIRSIPQSREGVASARNRGIREARPGFEYLAFLDHDDMLEPDMLESLRSALEATPGAVAAHGRRRNVDERGLPLRHARPPVWPSRRRGVVGKGLKLWAVDAPTTFSVLAYANVIAMSGALSRRRDVEAVGGFDTAIAFAEDWDFWLRMSRRGEIVFLDRITCRYRHHDANMSRDGRRAAEGRRTVRRKLIASPEVTREERRMLRVGYRFYELYRTRESLRAMRRALRRRRLGAAVRHASDAGLHLGAMVRPML
jgi:glycosyltransferase involved in cell wall biosynthesis